MSDQPLLTKDGIERAAGRLFLMPFFPAGGDDRATVIEELLLMCHSDAHALWLAYRVIQIFPKAWPGLGEVRAIYCKRFKPKDGLEMISLVFPDGLPSEKQLGPLEVPGLLEANQLLRLEAPPARKQIEAPVETMGEKELHDFHAETIGAVMESKQQPITPSQRDLLQAQRVAAILDDDADQAMALTRKLARPTPDERRQMREAERHIAEAKPTLTAEEKARRVAECEAALTKRESVQSVQ